MARLTTLQMPIDWTDLGLPASWQSGSTCIVQGDPAWQWDGGGPPLAIAVVPRQTAEPVADWNLDTVVMLAPDLGKTIESLQKALGPPRLQVRIENRPTAFYRVGPTLEIIEAPVRSESLFGVTLVTSLPLDVVARNWREHGLTVTDPQPAIQAGRQIITVKGTTAGLAVLSPDGPRSHP